MGERITNASTIIFNLFTRNISLPLRNSSFSNKNLQNAFTTFTPVLSLGMLDG